MILKLIIGNIFGNKRKTLVTIICICFSVMLIYVSINSYVSYQKMRIENAYDSYGKYHLILHEVDGDVYNFINENYADKAQIGTEKIAGITDSGITLIDCDSDAILMNGYEMDEGSFPAADNEVAVSATAKYDGEYIVGNYSIGDSIVLNDTEYIISGILDDYDYSTEETYKLAVIRTDADTDTYNIYLHFNDKGAYGSSYNEIVSYLGVDEENITKYGRDEGFLGGYRLIVNSDLNVIEIDGESSLQDINIGKLLFGFIIILTATSLILGIYVFLSYLNNRNRQQGILMCLGFSKKYISFIYLAECLVLAVIGCILGIVLGRYLTIFLFHIIQSMRTIKLENFKPEFTAFSLKMVIIISLVNFLVGMLPVLMRNSKLGIVDIIKGKQGRYKISRKSGDKRMRFVTAKYFLRDNYGYEKLCIYISIILIGMTFMLMLKVNKYIEYMLSNNEEYSSQFQLLTNDASGMENIQDFIPNIDSFDMFYDVYTRFYIDEEDINEKYADVLSYEDGTLICEIAGISEAEYKLKIEMSDEISYDEFVQSGGAIIIDNYLSTDEHLLKSVPSILKYKEINSDIANFAAGEIPIKWSSKYKNWDNQCGISIVIPRELFEEKLDYSLAVFKINAKSGHETEVAKELNYYSYIYDYTFNDNATEYIKEQDDNRIVRMCMYGILTFVTIINMFTTVYINTLIYMRRRKNISILKVTGHSNMNIMLPVILELIVEAVISTIIAAFAVTVLVKRYVPEYTQDIILTDGLKNMIFVLAFIILMQVISALNILIRINKQNIINDLRL